MTVFLLLQRLEELVGLLGFANLLSFLSWLKFDLTELDLLRSLPRRRIWINFQLCLHRRRTLNLLRLRLNQSFADCALGERYRVAL